MKKASYFLLGIIIGVLATYFFCVEQVDKSAPIIIKPKGVITQAQAKELNANWTLYRKRAVDSAAQRQGRNQDDRSVWWALDDVENYLGYVKNQADSLGYDMTGVRIYLGVYGKNAGQTKKDLTTMFIVPTGKKSVSKANGTNFLLPPPTSDLPVDPLNEGTGGDGSYPQ